MSPAEKLAELERKLDALGDEVSRERVDVLNELAFETGFADVEKTSHLGEKAVELSRELGYPHGLARGLLSASYHDYFAGRYDAALRAAYQALEIFEELDERDGVGQVDLGLGLAYWGLGDYEQAMERLHHGIETLRELGHKENEAWGHTSLGGVFENVGDLDAALECHSRALALFRETGNEVGIGRVLTGVGAVYRRQGKLDEALEYAFRSLELSERTGHRISVSRALNDIGVIHLERGELDQAQQYFERALELRRETGQRTAEITSLLDLGRVFLERGELTSTRECFESALAIAEETGSKPKIFRAHELLSRAYEESGDYASALSHHRAFQRIKEQVIGEESATKLKHLQVRFEAESLERLKKAQARLIQSEKMASLGKLVAGLAHEFNSPVGVILSANDVTERALATLASESEAAASLEELESSPKFRAAISSLRDNRKAVAGAATRLSTLVESLKRFIHLDEAEFQQTDIREGIESTLALLEPSWGERIRVVKKLEPIPTIQAYPSELNQAFMTLLLNAAEAIDGTGTITVETAPGNGHVRIVTSDTGRGLPKDRLESIFDVGFSRKGTHMRLHVGLANVRATVAKHDGEIRVESEPDRGTSFEILLPVRQG